MAIKEKDSETLEKMILSLLNKSPAIQNKLRSICGLSQNIPSGSYGYSAEVPQTEQLTAQIKQYKSDYQQTAAKLQEYKNYSTQLQSKCNALETDRSNLQNRVSQLENELISVKSQWEKSEKRSASLQSECERLKESEQSLSASLTTANQSVKIMKERFSQPVVLLNRYKSLSSSIRTGLSDVIRDDDEILFIASCSTPDHLKAIWEYTKRLAGSNSSDASNIEVLSDLFDYFFEVFNRTLSKPMYERDDVETGYFFDDDKYDRCAGSATSGKITQVILRGYRSVNTGNIICRSLVRV